MKLNLENVDITIKTLKETFGPLSPKAECLNWDSNEVVTICLDPVAVILWNIAKELFGETAVDIYCGDEGHVEISALIDDFYYRSPEQMQTLKTLINSVDSFGVNSYETGEVYICFGLEDSCVICEA